MNEKFANSEKTGKQCRERWHNHLNPSLIKDSFTIQDEIKVFEYQKQLGNSWSEIAAFFPGRNDNFIKNCFYSAIRRNLRKYNKKKVPSKQLKGTINSLLKNSHARKILLNFPEHLNPELAEKQKKVEPVVEKAETDTGKKGKKAKSVEKPIKETKAIAPKAFSWPGRNEKSFMSVNTRIPHLPAPIKEIDDITPRLYPQFSGIPDEIEIPELATKNISLDLIKCESNISEVSTTRNYILPDYSPKSRLQFYFSPRNSS